MRPKFEARGVRPEKIIFTFVCIETFEVEPSVPHDNLSVLLK
jgi:hypothetical protein